MATSSRGPRDSRPDLARVFITQGVVGFVLLVALTVIRRDETAALARSLGPDVWILGGIFFVTVIALQALRFELTRDLHVALGITAYVAMFPLLGPVLGAWVGSFSAISERTGEAVFARLRGREAPVGASARIAGFFATYGIPIALAGLVYESLGGVVGRGIEPTWRNAGLIAIGGTVLILSNSVVMLRPGRAMGLSWGRIARLYSIDLSIHFLTLPLAIVVAMSFGAFGLVGVVALLAQLIMAFFVTRKMALAQRQSRQLLQRLASLTNIGRAISLTTTDNLLMTVYTECKKVIDTTVFSIALLDEKTRELTLELMVQNDEILPKQRIPPGQGLNHWIVENHAPLLLDRHGDEERILGVTAFDDGLVTESWLGVPMIARDRVIGVIAVQSYRAAEFTRDDVLLLTAVANQAAVAIDNAKLYEELEDLTYALEERVQERTNELRETNLQLMAADHAKNEFLAKMSHELRTPLNSIIGFSSILLQSPHEEMPPKLSKFLDNINAAGNHLLNLINDILDLSKIEAGKVELRLETFDLRETVLSVERVMKGFADEAAIRIRTIVDEDVPLVTLDEGRLKQILFNLLSNAVKFSPEGGPVSLRISRVHAGRSPLHCDSVRIEVADQGLGIPREDLGRIFDEFYQSGQNRRTAKSGTGLGLSLTRNFVELHRGTIEVKSEPGKGSTFVMHLPVRYSDTELLTEPPTYGASESRWVH
jgi:signal transduction histidine kinase